MDKLVVLLYDLSAVLIILMTVAYSAQRGFATGIFRLLGRLAALFGSAFLAKNGAELIYDQFLKTEVTGFLNQNLQGGQLTDIIAQLQAGLQQLPKVYSNVIGMAIDTDSISQALNSGAAQLTAALEQSVIGPAVRGALSAVIFSLCYLLLSGQTVPAAATMNAGELYTFFRLRTCTRAQWEIRAIAVEALHVLRKAHPLLFALYGPTCFMTGHCPEGKMCCGRQAEIRQQFQ